MVDNTLKQLFLTLLLFLCVGLSGYSQPRYRERRPIYRPSIGTPQINPRYSNTVCVTIDEARSFLFVNGEPWWYLGEVSLRTTSQYNTLGRETFQETVKNGSGIMMQQVSDESGKLVFEYYLGKWKGDMRHGDIITKTSDGAVTSARWRYDRKKKGTERPATEEEKEQMEKAIRRLNGVLKLYK